MVYYQSTPLIIKTEQPSQAQYCTPLRTEGSAATATPSSLHQHQQQQHHQQQLQQQQKLQQHNNAPHNFSIGNVPVVMQQQQPSTSTQPSISHEQMQQHFTQQPQSQPQHQQHQQHHQQQQQPNGPNHTYLTSIKTERLPPGISVYATSSSPSAVAGGSGAATVLLPPPLVAASSAKPAQPSAAATTTPSATATATGRKSAGNKPQFKCEQCGMTFGSKSAHTSHTKSHAKNGELSLSAAGSASSIEVNEAGVPLGIPKTPQIKPNASGVAGGDPYQCNVCQKMFAVPARLIRHYRTHTGERPFECEFCHKLFSVKENLQVHRRIHTKERPYKCDVCGRAFEHSGKLHRHMRIHTGERPHKCSVCEKTFIQSGQLVIHMRTHTGEKPYKCPVEGCGKGFTCSKQLKVHSRTHTGEKPYHCDICFRDFGYNHVLKLHRVQHYGSKCYKCTICDETFKSKKEMEAHIKGHANELPDDDEEVAANGGGNGVPASASSSSSVSASTSGGETTSAPSSPQSPTISACSAPQAKGKKPKQSRGRSTATAANTTTSTATTVLALGPPSPSSPSSGLSPNSSLASASRLSADSPALSSSPTMSMTLETDHHSRDSGVASSSNNRPLSASMSQMLAPGSTIAWSIQELPTDLSMQQPTANYYQQDKHQHQRHESPVYQQQHHHQRQQDPQQPESPLDQDHHRHHDHHTHEQQQQQDQQHSEQLEYTFTAVPQPHHQTHQVHHYMEETHHEQHELRSEQPTINPALLEAASIASRRAMLVDPRNEEDVTQAALQIMQLHRSQTQQMQHKLQPVYHSSAPSAPSSSAHPTELSPTQAQPTQTQRSRLVSDLPHYDDTREANELIEHYKRGELARHGIHKGYAPVPEFKPALLNNEHIVRQVEAAIAPLRSSTESPERSSSPESDSMIIMAERDMMTLPLRKRKLYMNEGPNVAAVTAPNSNTTANSVISNGNVSSVSPKMGAKVMRESSVIQFAKASLK